MPFSFRRLAVLMVKRLLQTLLAAALLFGGCVFILGQMNRPPSESELAAVWAKNNAQREQNERVKESRGLFIAEMMSMEGVQSVEIQPGGEVVIVRFAPLVHTGVDHVRVLCEGMAQKWATLTALDYVRCESWYGNKKYASGTYSR